MQAMEAQKQLMKKMKVIIADDFDIIRFALRELLERYREMYPLEVLFEADTGKQAVEAARQIYPDLIIMDLMMPEMNGLEATRHIKKISPECKIVILTGSCRRNYIRELLQIGISGVIHKSQVLKEIHGAIETVLRGDVYLSPKVSTYILEDYTSFLTGKSGDVHSEKLTKRQKEVLKLIAEGKGTKEIAQALRTSITAVESMRYRLMHKLNIDNIADLTKYAIREGIIDLEL